MIVLYGEGNPLRIGADAQAEYGLVPAAVFSFIVQLNCFTDRYLVIAFSIVFKVFTYCVVVDVRVDW